MNSLAIIKKIAPSATVDLATIVKTVDQYGSRYQVDSDKRKDAFWANAAHETAGFKTLKEYATGAAYEGRADLGNIYPGDGVKFKGRGIFQTTGRANYRAVSLHLFGDERLLNNPELLEQPKWAALAALYFWKTRNLGPLADKGDFEGITRKINGGLNGWADRLNYYEQLKLYIFNQPTRNIVFAAGGAALIGTAIYLYVKTKKAA